MLKSFISYKNYNILQLIKCKLDTKYIDFKSDFYRGIFDSWYNVYSKVSEKECIDECLWDNKYVIINDKPTLFTSWRNNKINLLRDILDAHGKILSKQSLEDKYRLNIKQMDYNSLIHSLPYSWKKGVNIHAKCVNKDSIVLYYKERVYKL